MDGPAEWREEAWRKAEMLADAEDETELLEIAEMIERDATASAMLMDHAYAYDGELRDASDRNSHCEASHADSWSHRTVCARMNRTV